MPESEFKDRDCPECEEETVHEYLGLLPMRTLLGSEEIPKTAFTKTWGCTECGKLEMIKASDEEMEEADITVVEFMYENGIINKQKAKEMHPEDIERTEGEL